MLVDVQTEHMQVYLPVLSLSVFCVIFVPNSCSVCCICVELSQWPTLKQCIKVTKALKNKSYKKIQLKVQKFKGIKYKPL